MDEQSVLIVLWHGYAWVTLQAVEDVNNEVVITHDPDWDSAVLFPVQSSPMRDFKPAAALEGPNARNRGGHQASWRRGDQPTVPWELLRISLYKSLHSSGMFNDV